MRLQHSVVAVDEIDHVKRCRQLIREMEEMGGELSRLRWTSQNMYRRGAKPKLLD